jgi:hypothetical protein
MVDVSSPSPVANRDVRSISLSHPVSQVERVRLNRSTNSPLDKITRIMAELALDHDQRDPFA